MQPLPVDVLETKRAEERAQGRQRPVPFFSLIYNELHRDAATWFGGHGWDARRIVAADYFVELGEPVPEPDTDGGQMVYANSLVTARKRRSA
jgi:hypothetical protein